MRYVLFAVALIMAAPAAMAANDERNPASIDAQIKCAAQAERFLQKWERDVAKLPIKRNSIGGPTMANHYNAKLNRCIVHISDVNYEIKYASRSEYLIDAIEGVGFGNVTVTTFYDGDKPAVVNFCSIPGFDPRPDEYQCPRGNEEAAFDAYYNKLMKE